MNIPNMIMGGQVQKNLLAPAFDLALCGRLNTVLSQLSIIIFGYKWWTSSFVVERFAHNGAVCVMVKRLSQKRE